MKNSVFHLDTTFTYAVSLATMLPSIAAAVTHFGMQPKKQPAIAKLTLPKGFKAAGGTFGLKASGLPDMAMIAADVPCDAAGMFTRNKVPGAPVIVSKQHLRTPRIRAIICNSGCSNVCTGQRGLDDAKTMCHITAEHLNCKPKEILVCSTGVIGVPLPMTKITTGIPALASTLARGRTADEATAKAILTTDLIKKTAYRRITLGKQTVHLAAVAKGSGMIAPNMATMLAFITTDAAIDSTLLSQALKNAVNNSFNRLSVDTDTSTSDSVLCLASGMAGNPRITAAGRDYDTFANAICDLCQDLAYQVISDGEGVSRVFRVSIKHAFNVKDADRIGRSIVGSPLVKTAVHGGDPNWGRLLMAVGKSGAKVKPEKLSLIIDNIRVLDRGGTVTLTAAQSKKLDKIMQNDEVAFTVDLGLGDGAAEWLGCDLSREYIAINADYTT